MEAKEFWGLLDKYRGKKNIGNLNFIDINYVLKLIPDKETGLNILDSNLFEAFEDMPFASDFIISFLSKILKDYNLNNVLDPWANIGQFLNIVDLPKEQKTGYILNKKTYDLNEQLNNDFAQHLGNPQDFLDNVNEKYDLIISNLPVALQTHRKDFGLLRTDVGLQIIIQSLQYLSDNGQLIATVSGSIFFNKKFIELIHMYNCKISAIFESPSGALNSHSRVPFYLILIEKGIQEEVFLAEILEDIQHQNKVIENFNCKKSDKSLSKGVLKPIDEINSITKLNLIREVDILIKKTGVNQQLITAFGVFKRLNELEQNDEFLLIPTFLTAKVKKGTLTEKIKENAYHIFVIDKGKVNIEYLLNFLNSALANKILSKYATGVVIPSLSKSAIKKLALPIPNLVTQNEVVSLDRRLNDIMFHLNTFKSKLWENHRAKNEINKELKLKLKNPDNTEWLEDLPFPLASIYWGYHSESKISRKVDYLILFFEGLCEFLDTLILSGLSSNNSFYNATVKEWLKNEDYKNWHIKSSFGGWQNLYSILSSKVRFHYNKSTDDKSFVKTLFSNANEDFFIMITSKKITNVFVEVLKLRNNFKGHGGVMSDKKLNEILLILENHFYEIKGIIVDGFSNINLMTIVPKSMGWNDEDNVFQTTCKLLKGSRSKFNQIEVQTNKPMAEGKLYLLPTNQFKPIELLPFVQMRQAPRTEQNACYFYNRIEGNKVRLVSYHYDKEEEVFIDLENISSFLDILNPTD